MGSPSLYSARKQPAVGCRFKFARAPVMVHGGAIQVKAMMSAPAIAPMCRGTTTPEIFTLIVKMARMKVKLVCNSNC